MIGQTKPFASLSSGLLARKGQARPAMRPQGFGGFGAPPSSLSDDLGWNDMGEDFASVPAVDDVPQVVRQIEALQEEFEAEVEPVESAPNAMAVLTLPAPVRSISVATASRLDRETHARTGKAAFTLRIDHDRHLRLRLASALHNRSAQALVTDALDALLASMDEVEELVRQIPPRKTRR